VFSQLLLYLAAKPLRLDSRALRGVPEHSSVMSLVLVASYINKCGAWLALRRKNENRNLESRTSIRENSTTDDLAGSAVTAGLIL
jgi:hypothetical protein